VTGGRTGGAWASLAAYVPILVWVLVAVTLVLIPLRIAAYGYIPLDDAVRHAAKAVCGKPWPEILVMRPDATIDSHAAWHAGLRALYLATGCGIDTLVVIPMAGLCLLVLFAPIPGLRAPEAWLASWAVACMTAPPVFHRLTLGRPYLVSVAVLLMLMTLWSRHAATRRGGAALAATVLLFFVSAWIHGSWYLLLLVPAAFAAARRWRAAGELTACWAVATVLAAVATGEPFAYLVGQVSHMLHAFRGIPVVTLLVSEFQPSGGGGVPALICVAAVVVWLLRGGRFDRLSRDPLLLLAAIGWVMGMRVIRFWADWGLPCAMLWIAFRLQPVFVRLGRRTPLLRLGTAAMLCASLAFMCVGDVQGRWTENLRKDYLSADNPDTRPWLPDRGGIVYTVSMGVFYDTFFKNPNGDWRYVLGFEPGLMTEEDRATFNHIRWNIGDYRAYKPWIDRMRPEDRLVILDMPGSRPNLPALEWHYAATGTWVGRLRRAATNSVPSGAASPPAPSVDSAAAAP
jgi:hypothetical protein